MQMAKNDKNDSVKSVERLKQILLSQHIFYIFCKDSGQLHKYNFCFEFLKRTRIFYEFGRRSHKMGAREGGLSEP